MKRLFFIVIILILFFSVSIAQSEKKVEIAAIPYNISWVNQPVSWKSDGFSFSIIGGKGSRLFVDPQQKIIVDTAPMALFMPDNEFLFTCKLKVTFKAVFDAGVLMVYGNSEQWAKLCFEYSPQLKPMVVSVVNDKFSDDANHDIIGGDEVYLRIAGLGDGAYVFHYSTDGKYWNMVRYFHLDPKHDLKIGFLSQSPRGEVCTTTFSEIKYEKKKLSDIRGGE